MRFSYNLLNRQGQFKKELKCIEQAKVFYDSLSQIKSKANFTIRDFGDIDYLQDMIQVICFDKEPVSIGVFVLTSPTKNMQSLKVIREVAAYSRLYFLEKDVLTEPLVVKAGTNIVSECLRLIGSYSASITPNSATMKSDKEYEIGTSKITVINDLLSIINYTSLRVTGEGKFVATPYVLPQDRVVEFIYEEGKDSTIFANMTIEEDLFNIYNVFTRYTNNPGIVPPIIATYENNNFNSPISIDKIGRRPKVTPVSDAVDYDTVYAQCKRDFVEQSQIYSKITFETRINPRHDYMSCVQIKNRGVDDIYIETNWVIDCKFDGRMTHNARRAISV